MATVNGHLRLRLRKRTHPNAGFPQPTVVTTCARVLRRFGRDQGIAGTLSASAVRSGSVRFASARGAIHATATSGSAGKSGVAKKKQPERR